jgi:anti-sigma regulatory factor (Ser/Thr protein kinase)
VVSARLPLPPHAQSLQPARDFVRQTLAQWGLPDITDDVSLVVTELVTNAITHAASRCELQLDFDGSTVEIQVVDHGAGIPEIRDSAAHHQGGRGLQLVEAVSAQWGVREGSDGAKVVWARLETS